MKIVIVIVFLIQNWPSAHFIKFTFLMIIYQNLIMSTFGTNNHHYNMAAASMSRRMVKSFVIFDCVAPALHLWTFIDEHYCYMYSIYHDTA